MGNLIQINFTKNCLQKKLQSKVLSVFAFTRINIKCGRYILKLPMFVNLKMFFF